MPLPVSIIIPTLNCRNQVEQHVAALKRWYHEAEEVIVVDSESEDGTGDWLRENVDHPRVRHFSRPRGLYAAWNFAVSQCSSRYVYFATVGDEICPDGVKRLCDAAEMNDVDLVISPPKIVDERGEPLVDRRWPIHRLLDLLTPAGPFRLNDWQKFALANAFDIQGLLGSSASNLYRREMLKANPFPEDFGHAGDTMWGRLHSSRIPIAVYPETVALFIVDCQSQAKPMSDIAYLEKVIELEAVALQNIEADSPGLPGTEAAMIVLGRMLFTEWTKLKVRDLAHLEAVCAQQLTYIGELEEACEARLAQIRARDGEIQRLRGKLNKTVIRRLRSIFR